VSLEDFNYIFPTEDLLSSETVESSENIVLLKDLVLSNEFKKSTSALTVCIGKDANGKNIITDIAEMPHLMIAGVTGSGKSVCLHSLIISLLYKTTPQKLRIVMIDTKGVELSAYNGIPHLEVPVVTNLQKAIMVLEWATKESEKRCQLLIEKGVKDLNGYNADVEEKSCLPRFLIVIDEFYDCMEESIYNLVSKGRMAGIYLVIVTKKIPKLLKFNIVSRIVFRLSSQTESKKFLNKKGAEKLLGMGDMMFLSTEYPETVKGQGAFLSYDEIDKIVGNIKCQGDYEYNEEVMNEIDSALIGRKKGGSVNLDDEHESYKDKLLEEAIEMVVNHGTASVSYLQRKFGIGYSRAANMIDQMEEIGILSGNDGSKPRQVLMSKERFYDLKMNIDF